MKVRLLNDGGFFGLSAMKFPVQEEVVCKSQEIDLDALYAEMVESSNKRQEQLLSLIREYGNPQTGLDRAERIYKQIEKIIRGQLV